MFIGVFFAGCDLKDCVCGVEKAFCAAEASSVFCKLFCVVALDLKTASFNPDAMPLKRAPNVVQLRTVQREKIKTPVDASTIPPARPHNDPIQRERKRLCFF